MGMANRVACQDRFYCNKNNNDDDDNNIVSPMCMNAGGGMAMKDTLHFGPTKPMAKVFSVVRLYFSIFMV